MNIHEHMNERSEKNTHLLRVWVLGPLAIEWAEGTFPPERMCGRGSARALGLLKALLSQADRFATRDWLMEQFWPDSAISSAQERLDDVASGLRTLLRPPGSSANFLHYVHGSDGKGSGYRLEGYPRLWVDADAFGWLVEQACRLDRFGQDSLPLWEQAYQLGARGSFLPEERYSDWAQARRELLAGGYRQCVHRLAALLRARGANEQALLRLRTYWQAHSTDEDILRPLMELLGEQERYQEVEESYEKGREALLQEGKEPDSRTQDIAKVMRIKQIQRIQPMTREQKPLSSLPFPQGLTSIKPFMDTSLIVAQGFPSFALRYNTKENTETTYSGPVCQVQKNGIGKIFLSPFE